MLEKKPKYSQANIIWDKISKYDIIEWGRGTFLNSVLVY